jgi:hypothetical protein
MSDKVRWRCGVVLLGVGVKDEAGQPSRLQIDEETTLSSVSIPINPSSDTPGRYIVIKEELEVAVVEIGCPEDASHIRCWEKVDRVTQFLEVGYGFSGNSIIVLTQYRVPEHWRNGDALPPGAAFNDRPITVPLLPGEFVIDPNSDFARLIPTVWAQWNHSKIERVSTVIQALRQSNQREIPMRIAMLVQCAESLLSEAPGDLRYKYALRGAYLFAPAQENRLVWFKALKVCYDIRSDVVHGKSPSGLRDDLRNLEKSVKSLNFDLNGFVSLLDRKLRILILDVVFSLTGNQLTKETWLSHIDECLLAGSEDARSTLWVQLDESDKV